MHKLNPLISIKKICSLFLLILLIITIPHFANAQKLESISHNTKGFELYKTKNFHKAIDYFNLAIKADYSNYIAHYNLACTYSLLTINDGNCNTEYFKNAISALEDCYALDSLKTKEKATKDKDFDNIRTEYEFNVLIYGLDFNKAEFVRGFIVGKTFKTSIPGSTYYPIEELTINADNTWVYSFHKNSEEMNSYWHGEQVGTAPTLIEEIKKGTWKLSGHILTLLDESNNVYKIYTLLEPGKINDLYYPDPNDLSGQSEVRHYWKCGKCGCGLIDN